MNTSLSTQADKHLPIFVPAGEDRLGYFKTLGISSVAFKVTSQESSDLFVSEVTLVQKGGPGKHIHHQQDEWWYILEGEFIFEVGEERFHLKPGDSLFGPREMPHAFAFVAGTRGRLLGSVMPAGSTEAFIVNADKNKTLVDLDTDLRPTYELEWVGPPLTIE